MRFTLDLNTMLVAQHDRNLPVFVDLQSKAVWSPRPGQRLCRHAGVDRVQDRALSFHPEEVAAVASLHHQPFGSAGERSRSGETITQTRPAPASRAARIGQATIGRPQTSCSTLGRDECMRVPWPAAMINAVGAFTRKE